MEETLRWEYRVQTFGGLIRSTNDAKLEAELDEWGMEGWEVISAVAPDNSSAVRVIAKRPLSRQALRRRSLPA